ncbi:MAG: MBL fold metallo-hydrolase [Verrucomicrobiaceae bacterium]|nr:MBL fold metallo-hydrolase [Verrucomicrobiaceae bacterium]
MSNVTIQTFTGGIAATNGHFLSLPGGNVLVDAPEGVAAWLEKLGFKVDVLFLTHQHFDHVLDAAKVRAGHGCRVFSWSAHSVNLTLERLFGAVTGTSMAVTPFEVDELLEGKTSVEACGVTWRLFHVPGHSPDSVCFLWEAQNLLFGGDVLFRDSIGRTDFPGGSMRQLVEGIQTKLLTLPDDTLVYPGHGPHTSIGAERRENEYLQA